MALRMNPAWALKNPGIFRMGLLVQNASTAVAAAPEAAAAAEAPTASGPPQATVDAEGNIVPPNVKAIYPSFWDWGKFHVPSRVPPPMPKDFKEFPERDLVNFPHEELKLYPESKVRMAFIPDSWFQFFYNKTGVTGPYLLGGGMVLFLLQKEILPFAGQTFYVPAFVGAMWMITRIMGARIRAAGEKKLAEELEELDQWQEGLQKEYKDAITTEGTLQESYKSIGEFVFPVKKENVLFQLESNYRERLDTAHKEVKRRLDYLVQAEETKRRFEQKHMVDWIVGQVKKSITADLEKAYLSQCIGDLQALAPK